MFFFCLAAAKTAFDGQKRQMMMGSELADLKQQLKIPSNGETKIDRMRMENFQWGNKKRVELGRK